MHKVDSFIPIIVTNGIASIDNVKLPNRIHFKPITHQKI